MDIESTIGFLNSLKLSGLANIKCGELLSTIIFSDSQKLSSKALLKTMLSFSFGWGLSCENNRGKDFAFVFSPSYYGRKEYYDLFNDVCELSDSFTSYVAKKSFRINLSRIINFFRWFFWNNKLKAKVLDKKTRWNLCNYLLLAINCSNDFFKKASRIRYKAITTFCDTHPVDYLITKIAYLSNIKTITLQHAAYFYKTHWYEYRYSHSDIFCGISEFAKIQAEKSGYDFKKKFLICGSMKNIKLNHNNSDISHFPSRVSFGLATSGTAFSDENYSLIDYSYQLCVRRELKCIIRLHPATKNSVKNALLKYPDNVFMIDDSKDLVGFGKKCDFILTGTSNIFADLICLNIPSFRMVGNYDFFEIINDFKFNKFDELMQLIDCLYTNGGQEIQEKIYKYKNLLSPNIDVKEAYSNIYRALREKSGE